MTDRRTDMQEKRLRKEQLELELESPDLQAVLDLPQGRKFLWWLLGKTGLYRTSFTGNSATFYNEGRRDIGIAILNEILTVDPEAYIRMQAENLRAKTKKNDEEE